MRTLPSAMRAKIDAGDFTGANKATTRVTIQKVLLATHAPSATGLYTWRQYYGDGSVFPGQAYIDKVFSSPTMPTFDQYPDQYGGYTRLNVPVLINTDLSEQVYSSIVFPASTDPARELPNVKSLSWSRDIDTDVGSMSMELFNTEPLPPGTGPDVADSFDLLGYYTYNRGRTSFSQGHWGHTPNQWQDFLVPDRMVRVYQGYGADYSVVPELDPNLVLMGVYLIDDVIYTADGLITVEARDVGRLLYDQIMFPPVVPLSEYPLQFERYRQVADPPRPADVIWKHPVYRSSSNTDAFAVQHGHHGADAFDGSLDTFWLSRGHDYSADSSSFTWIQGNVAGETVKGVEVTVRGGPYTCYLSIYTDATKGSDKTGWRGVTRIPYKVAVPPKTGGGLLDVDADIPYVKSQQVPYMGSTIFFLDNPVYKGVTILRLTFTNLWKTNFQPGPYRTAVTNFRMYSQSSGLMPSGTTHTEGNYEDYTEIVKKLLAYGGFYWPQNATQTLTDGNTRSFPLVQGDDPILGTGRIWGDIMLTGTNGPAPLGIEVWDKKPLIDGINYVKDIVGFVFYIDEVGGAIFRSPNTYKVGNWLVDKDCLNAASTTSIATLYDDQVILGLRARLSSRNLRESVFVANVDGQIGAVSRGRIRYPSNFRRVAGWTDQNFEKQSEAQVMADLITLRQLFTFRTDSVRIPADPSIQIDDQIRIVERTTGDAYLHYVRSIASEWDLASGKWTYDLTTSWLGENPQGEWAFRTTDLAPETQQFLDAIGGR